MADKQKLRQTSKSFAFARSVLKANMLALKGESMGLAGLPLAIQARAEMERAQQIRSTPAKMFRPDMSGKLDRRRVTRSRRHDKVIAVLRPNMCPADLSGTHWNGPTKAECEDNDNY